MTSHIAAASPSNQSNNQEDVKNKEGISSIRLEVLRGAFNVPIDLWKLPVWKMTLFVSSTFTDTIKERNYLLETVHPYLFSLGRKYGINVSFVDMRWGVRDENTEDHLTWIACAK